MRARLRREHQIRVGGKQVLRLMRRHGLFAPQRVRGRRKPRPHDGTIIPDGPNLRWGTDATMAWTRTDGWVWVFVCVDHYTAEAWTHVAKIGDRIAALQPVYDAVVDRFGRLGPDAARGVKLRHDWGPQYRSHHFLGSITWLGLTDDAASIGEPETNGCAERFIRTLKEQCLGPSCMTPSMSFATPSTPGPTPTTANGSSNATDTSHHERHSPQPPPRWQHETDTPAVQRTGRCSGVICR